MSSINTVSSHSLSQPISVQSGDILGVFAPQTDPERPMRLTLLSEAINSQTAYYTLTGDSESSLYEEIDLNSNELTYGNFQPLITIEFGKQKFIIINTTKLVLFLSLAMEANGEPATTVMMPLNTPKPSLPALPPALPTIPAGSGPEWLGVGIGVAIALLALLALVACITLYLRWRKRRKASNQPNTMNYQHNNAVGVDEIYEYTPRYYTYPVLEAPDGNVLQPDVTHNIAYGMGRDQGVNIRNMTNSAASAVRGDGVVYNYATTETGDQVLPSNVPVSLNQAYIAALERTLAL